MSDMPAHREAYDSATINTCAGCGAARYCALRRHRSGDSGAGVIQRRPPVPAGTVLFHQGDAIDSLFIVRAGAVKTTRVAPDGTQQITGFYLAGDLFGLDSLAAGARRETATSRTTTSLCRIQLKDVDACGLTPRALATLCSEVIEERSRLIERLTQSADQRVAALLLELSQRFAQRGLSPTNFDLPMARTDVASYLQLSQETVSRVFSRLTEARLVQAKRSHVRLRNPEALRNLVENTCGTSAVRAA